MLTKQLLICYFHLIITVNTRVQTPVTSTHAVNPARPLQAKDVPPDFTVPTLSTTGILIISKR